MFRLWAKTWKYNHMISDITIENNREDTRTHKIFQALEEVCDEFDLSLSLIHI